MSNLFFEDSDYVDGMYDPAWQDPYGDDYDDTPADHTDVPWWTFYEDAPLMEEENWEQ